MITVFRSRLRSWLEPRDRAERGQGLVEYALIIVMIAIAATVAMEALGGGVTGVFGNITSTLNGGSPQVARHNLGGGEVWECPIEVENIYEANFEGCERVE